MNPGSPGLLLDSKGSITPVLVDKNTFFEPPASIRRLYSLDRLELRLHNLIAVDPSEEDVKISKAHLSCLRIFLFK
jgi:hypothetical protein